MIFTKERKNIKSKMIDVLEQKGQAVKGVVLYL